MYMYIYNFIFIYIYIYMVSNIDKSASLFFEYKLRLHIEV